mmetsp:Transcript_31101/g.75170  ORF Transcript_31101/g.75170 Transcript_31101/m.75170 type:complete len:443 (+) Transcript_31101:140-1468(+)
MATTTIKTPTIMTTSSTKEDDTTMPSHHHDRPVATLDEAGPPPSKRVRYDDGATTSSAINTLAAMAMMAMSSNGSDLDSASSAATAAVTNSLIHPHSSSSEQAVVSASSSSSSDSDDEESSGSSDTNEDDVRNPPLPNHSSTNVDSDSDSDGYIEDRRRVRFAPPAVSSADDAAGDADADHNHASAAVLTLIGPDAQHPRPTKQDGFWWTRSDRCSFLEDSHVLLDEFREEHSDDQLRNFQRVQDKCMNSCHSGTAPARGTSRLSVETESAYLPALILPASVRGLEWGLQRRPEDDDDEQAGRRHQKISSYQRRRDHRRRILELQEEILLEQEDDDDVDDDSSTGLLKRDLSALLRQQSEKSSRGHRVLARLLAKGDEIQAKGGRTISDRVSSSPLSPTTSSPSSGLNHRYPHLATTSGIAIRPKPQQLFRSRCSIMGGRPY